MKTLKRFLESLNKWTTHEYKTKSLSDYERYHYHPDHGSIQEIHHDNHPRTGERRKLQSPKYVIYKTHHNGSPWGERLGTHKTLQSAKTALQSNPTPAENVAK